MGQPREAGEPQRCATHGVVLTGAGTCLLCARRTGRSPSEGKGGRGMTWLVVGVVGALLLSASGFRLYRYLGDQRAAEASLRAEPSRSAANASATGVALLPPHPGSASPSPSPGAGREEARREHERRVEEAERAVQIDLYGEGWCPSCSKARTWLDAKGIAYTYRDTSDTANKLAMRALNPKSTIPTIAIEGELVVGFNPQAMRAAIRRAAEVRVSKAH